MDAINIILEFESPDRDLINQDIYNEERGCVDFGILIPCPAELETLIAGSSEDDAIRLLKKHGKEFNVESATLKEDIKGFIKQCGKDQYFLSDERLTEETLESIKNCIIAYQKYGYENWLAFKRDKWGVSQNAFVYANGKKKRTSTGGFYFVTGWCIPKKWLLALSEKWKDVNFKVYGRMEFANRQGNVTEYNFLNGKCKMIGDVKRKF